MKNLDRERGYSEGIGDSSLAGKGSFSFAIRHPQLSPFGSQGATYEKKQWSRQVRLIGPICTKQRRYSLFKNCLSASTTHAYYLREEMSLLGPEFLFLDTIHNVGKRL